MKGRIIAAVAGLALLITGCSAETDQPETKVEPPASREDAKPKEGGADPSGLESEAKGEDAQAIDEKAEDEKSEADVQAEIKEKLARMTQPRGYTLNVDSQNRVLDALSLSDVAEQLRKRGFAQQLAERITEEFYREQDGAVVMLARDGLPGVFESVKEASFTKKNKYVWTVTQKHPESGLHDPHTAVYEVEVLKDGTYRLNAWSVNPL